MDQDFLFQVRIAIFLLRRIIVTTLRRNRRGIMSFITPAELETLAEFFGSASEDELSSDESIEELFNSQNQANHSSDESSSETNDEDVGSSSREINPSTSSSTSSNNDEPVAGPSNYRSPSPLPDSYDPPSPYTRYKSIKNYRKRMNIWNMETNVYPLKNNRPRLWKKGSKVSKSGIGKHSRKTNTMVIKAFIEQLLCSDR